MSKGVIIFHISYKAPEYIYFFLLFKEEESLLKHLISYNYKIKYI